MKFKNKMLDIYFKNPVILASGPAGNGQEIKEELELSLLGGFTTKTITYNKIRGNPPPRIVDVYGGILNSVGLQNEGVKNFKDELKIFNDLDTNIICSVGGFSKEEYVKVVNELKYEKSIKIFELNLSCPNVSKGKGPIGQDPDIIKYIIKEIKLLTSKPIFVKFGPESNLIDLVAIADDSGIDGVTLINCPLGMRIDIHTGKPILKRNSGGFSGPAIKPIAIYHVFNIRANFPNIPIIGTGGVTSYEDVIEFIMAGANLVGIGTGVMMNPKLPIEIINDLKNKTSIY